jgi:hypothetical protein
MYRKGTKEEEERQETKRKASQQVLCQCLPTEQGDLESSGSPPHTDHHYLYILNSCQKKNTKYEIFEVIKSGTEALCKYF